MLTAEHSRKVLSLADQDILIDRCSRNPRHLVLVLLMADCGLRVTEAIRVRHSHFNMAKGYVRIKSLKKRKVEEHRDIPLTARLVDAYARYYTSIKNRKNDDYLFLVRSTGRHMSRQAAWKIIKQKSQGIAHPHALRHTYATRIVNEGNDIRIAQKLLGHKSFVTTEIYTHANYTDALKAVKSIEKESWIIKLKRRLNPKRNVFHLDDIHSLTGVFVGRTKELDTIEDLRKKRVNTLVVGPQGIGKSEIIKQAFVDLDSVIEIDDLTGIKKTLGNILLHYSEGDKKAAVELVCETEHIDRFVNKATSARIIETISRLCEKDKDTLIVHDLTDITKAGVRVLEKLKNIFHIVAAARKVKVAHASFLTNFEKVEVKPLTRIESIKMINTLSRSMRPRIEDYELFKNHVYSQSNGYPLYIYELIERYSKEVVISSDNIRDVTHQGALKDIDISVPLVVGISSLMVLRYVGGELGDDSGAFKLFGGAFMLFALFARSILNFGKRKYY